MFEQEEYQWMRVYLYLRQSTKTESWKQVQSIEDQRKDCEAIIERFGLKVVEVIEEDESAWKPHQRPKFKRLLKELSYRSLAKRRADGIVAWHPNRLSRNALEAGMIVQMLDDGLIKNLFFSYAYSFHNDTSWKEHLTIEFARAKWYNDHLSEVVIRWIKSRELQGGMSSYTKYGYVQKREHKNPKLCSMFPIPHPERFAIVRRMFKLGLQGYSAAQTSKYLRQEYPEHRSNVNMTVVDRRLRDSFYCGQWVVRKGAKEERTIDLNKIALHDGTRFEPAISEADFARLQLIRATNRSGAFIKRKRVNPLPQMVSCGICGGKMYANYRKIKIAGWGKEERLGYECQNRPNWKRCEQSRVKVKIIFDRIAEELSKRSRNLNQLRYRRYLVAVHAFSKKKKDELGSERKRTTNALTKAEGEKHKLISQRADMITQNLFDPHSKKQFETRINELAELIEDLRYRKKWAFEKNSARILTFYKFLELRENLVQYWNFADYEKKGIFSKIALSNLTLRSQEVAILSFKKPFLNSEEGCFTSYGGQREVQHEPTLDTLWTWLQWSQNEPYVAEILSMIDSCKPAGPLKFPLIKDIEKTSGTRV